jgi:hypothetical protein
MQVDPVAVAGLAAAWTDERSTMHRAPTAGPVTSGSRQIPLALERGGRVNRILRLTVGSATFVVAAVATATGTASAQTPPVSATVVHGAPSQAGGAVRSDCPFDYGSPHSLGQDRNSPSAQQPLNPNHTASNASSGGASANPNSDPYSHIYGSGNPYGDKNGCVGIGGGGSSSTTGTTAGTSAASATSATSGTSTTSGAKRSSVSTGTARSSGTTAPRTSSATAPAPVTGATGEPGNGQHGHDDDSDSDN